MKKNLISFALAVLALASCSKNELGKAGDTVKKIQTDFNLARIPVGQGTDVPGTILLPCGHDEGAELPGEDFRMIKHRRQ